MYWILVYFHVSTQIYTGLEQSDLVVTSQVNGVLYCCCYGVFTLLNPFRKYYPVMSYLNQDLTMYDALLQTFHYSFFLSHMRVLGHGSFAESDHCAADTVQNTVETQEVAMPTGNKPVGISWNSDTSHV